MTPLPLQFALVLLTGWLSRHQQEVIEYLQEENRVLREQHGGKRLQFTDAQRRRLARKAKCLGRRRLRDILTVVTPDTLLRSESAICGASSASMLSTTTSNGTTRGSAID